MNHVETMALLGITDITDINTLFPDLVLEPVFSFARTMWRYQFDTSSLLEDALWGDYKCSREYGGIWVKDTDCSSVKEHTYTAERTESGSVFGYGTLMFDLDYKPSWKPELLTALSKTKMPWALCETPNGYHIHCLRYYWDNLGWASYWRTEYLHAYEALIKVGIKPDIKHVVGSLLQCRCYVRLQPKHDAAYAWHDPMYIGVREDLPVHTFTDPEGADNFYYYDNPGRLKLGTNYAANAMLAIQELATLRRP